MMRPTNKLVTTFTQDADRDAITRTNNSKVQRLMALHHSCLSCNYFPTAMSHGLRQLCKHPRSSPTKKPVRHYNICHLHSEVSAD